MAAPPAYRAILVAGGSGFVGSQLVARLVAPGREIILPTRHLDHARHLSVLPGVRAVQADIHDQDSLLGLVRQADVVINLVGILHSRPARGGAPYGADYARAHVALPAKIVAACAAAGVRRYLHMSALGASVDSPSMYGRSKAAGEAAACADPALEVTVFRPSVIFGPDDRFLNLFAALQQSLPVILLARAGARFQPVYVGDVARAMAAALDDRASVGQARELVGPHVYTLRQLVQLAGKYSGHPRPVLGLPDGMAYVLASLLEMLPGLPLLSRDNLDSMRRDNIASSPAVAAQPTPLEALAPDYLAHTP